MILLQHQTHGTNPHVPAGSSCRPAPSPRAHRAGCAHSAAALQGRGAGGPQLFLPRARTIHLGQGWRI